VEPEIKTSKEKVYWQRRAHDTSAPTKAMARRSWGRPQTMDELLAGKAMGGDLKGSFGYWDEWLQFQGKSTD